MQRRPIPNPSFDPEAIRQRVAQLRKRRLHRFRRRGPFAANMTPMIDMSFTMLIFFVATTTFDRPEGVLASKLPREQGEFIAPALPLSPILVRLSSEGDPLRCVIRIDRVARPPQNFTELSQTLKDLQQQPGFDDQTPVVLMSEDNVAWDHVVGAWNAAVRAGFKNLVFGQPSRK